MGTSIALCTYNGERFLQEQLDSIVRQTLLPDELVVCDDCSHDATIEILHKFKKTAPFAVQIFPNESNLGPAKNFAKAVNICQGDLICLCDQDDRWLPEKLKLTAQKLLQLEKSYSKETPLLVHTDAVVADGELREIHPSLWKFQHSYPGKGHTLAKLLSQNLVTGCTAAMNCALRDKALPMPNNVMMHDWWLALVASSYGQIGNVPESTMFYRQHGMNDTGAKSWGLTKALSSLLDIRNRNYILKKNKEVSISIRKQATEFLNLFSSDLTSKQQQTIVSFIELPERSYLVRKYLILKYGLHYQGWLRNIGNLILK